MCTGLNGPNTRWNAFGPTPFAALRHDGNQDVVTKIVVTKMVTKMQLLAPYGTRTAQGAGVQYPCLPGRRLQAFAAHLLDLHWTSTGPQPLETDLPSYEPPRDLPWTPSAPATTLLLDISWIAVEPLRDVYWT